MSLSYLSNLERGRGNPTLSTLRGIARAIRMPLRELIDVDEEEWRFVRSPFLYDDGDGFPVFVRHRQITDRGAVIPRAFHGPASDEDLVAVTALIQGEGARLNGVEIVKEFDGTVTDLDIADFIVILIKVQTFAQLSAQ